jgi:hypothetical protein
MNTRIALATNRKSNMAMLEYVTKIKSLADEMPSARKNIDEEYNQVISTLVARVEQVTMAEATS